MDLGPCEPRKEGTIGPPSTVCYREPENQPASRMRDKLSAARSRSVSGPTTGPTQRRGGLDSDALPIWLLRAGRIMGTK